MALFNESVDRALLQEEITNGKVYVYHMTSPEAVKGIEKTGADRWFVGNHSAAHGPGFYTTLYLSSDNRSRTANVATLDRFGERVLKKWGSNNDRNRGGIYGSYYVKFWLKSIKGFLCFDKAASRYLYGTPPSYKKNAKRKMSKNYYDIDEQFKLLLPPKLYHEIKNTNDFHECMSPTRWSQAYYGVRHADKLCQMWPEVNEYINGFIAHSPSDGYIVIVRDMSSLIPVEFSSDGGKHWKPIEEDPHFKGYVKDNIDLRRALRLDKVTDYNSKTGKAIYSINDMDPAFRRTYSEYPKRLEAGLKKEKPYDYLPQFLFGDFARVVKNGKYNYLYRGTLSTRKPISNVWWDKASETWNKNGWTRVEKNGHIYLLHNNDGNFEVFTPDKEFVCDLNQLDPQTGEPNVSDFSGFDNDW